MRKKTETDRLVTIVLSSGLYRQTFSSIHLCIAEVCWPLKTILPLLNLCGWFPKLHSSNEGSDFVVLKSHLHTLLEVRFSMQWRKVFQRKTYHKGEEPYRLKLDPCIWHTPRRSNPISHVKMNWFRTANVVYPDVCQNLLICPSLNCNLHLFFRVYCFLLFFFSTSLWYIPDQRQTKTWVSTGDSRSKSKTPWWKNGQWKPFLKGSEKEALSSSKSGVSGYFWWWGNAS